MSASSSVLFSGLPARNQTLEQTPFRVLTFLFGLSQHPELETKLAAAGFTKETHEQGWALLHACGGYGGMSFATDSTPAAVAIRALSDWCGKSFGRMQAALTHLHPEQEAYVFSGLAAVTGPAAVIAVELLVERLDDLAGTGKNAAARKDSADADKKALGTLAIRGFDDKELKRVHDLVVTAHTAAPPADGTKQMSASSLADALVELKAWFDDWSQTTRDVIEKRSDLIKLGLARPKKSKAVPADPATTAPVTPAPALGTPPVAQAPVVTAVGASPTAHT